MGQIRRTLIDQTPGCETVIACDCDPRELDIEYTTDPQAVIQRDDLDAVCVCTPNFMIKDLVVDALDANKHVLAEKPPGTSLTQVEEMRTAHERHPELKLKFGFNHRYHDAIMEARERVETGIYGKILWMRGRYGKSVDENYANTWRGNKELAGGGILLDQGIHMLDLFLHFCGNFEEVKSFCSSQYWKNLDVEDNVFAIFRNRAGQTASLHSTMTQWRHLFSLELFLEEGYMVVNGILSATRSYTTIYGKEELSVALNRSAPPVARHTHEERLVYDKDYSFKREVDEFVDCIREDTPIKIGTINDAHRLMTLIEKIYDDDRG
jgi:predicted dehydrogenase